MSKSERKKAEVIVHVLGNNQIALPCPWLGGSKREMERMSSNVFRVMKWMARWKGGIDGEMEAVSGNVFGNSELQDHGRVALTER